MNEYVISFILMGVITSLPEIFIGIASVVTNAPLISVGNIMGANFANITLTLGLVAILANGVDISRQVSRRVFWLSLLLTLLPSFLIFGGGISRLEGLLLCFIFLAYIAIFSYDAEFLEKSVPHIPYGIHYFSDIYPSLINLFLGLITLVASSIFIVFFIGDLAGYLAVDIILFSTVFLGLITTLPELFFGIRGALLQHPSLALGNIVASTVFNATAIIGAVSIISPTIIHPAGNSPLILNAIFMIAGFFFLSIFSYTGSKITRTEGKLLVFLYLLFLVSVLVFLI